MAQTQLGHVKSAVADLVLGCLLSLGFNTIVALRSKVAAAIPSGLQKVPPFSLTQVLLEVHVIANRAALLTTQCCQESNDLENAGKCPPAFFRGAVTPPRRTPPLAADLRRYTSFIPAGPNLYLDVPVGC